MSHQILKIDSSSRVEASSTRIITHYIAEQLLANTTNDKADNLLSRDLLKTPLSFLQPKHLEAFATARENRTHEQEKLLNLSTQLIDELRISEQLIIGSPIYNFSVPATLKAWIDLICRAGETFRYTEHGPEGLLSIKRAFIVVASGGTEVGGEIDFASAYLEHICRFIGIETVHIIRLDGSKRQADKLLNDAKQQVDSLLQATVAA